MYRSILLFLLIPLHTIASHPEKLILHKNVEHVLAPIIQNAKDLVAYSRAYNVINPYDSQRPSIGIEGGAYVGKKYLAKLLAQLLLQKEDIKTAIINLDDFTAPESIRYPYTLEEFPLNVPAIHDILRKICIKDTVIKPTWTFTPEGPILSEETLHLKGIDLLLFTGKYALSGKQLYNFSHYSALHIYLQAEPNHVLKQALHKEQITDLPSKKKFIKNFLYHLNNHSNYALETIRQADYMITLHENNSYSISNFFDRHPTQKKAFFKSRL